MNLRQRIEAAILEIPDLLNYVVWKDNPLDGYSTVLRGERDVARLAADAAMRVLGDE